MPGIPLKEFQLCYLLHQLDHHSDIYSLINHFRAKLGALISSPSRYLLTGGFPCLLKADITVDK